VRRPIRLELVGVVPELVRALKLGVDEALARHPLLDSRQPADREPVQRQPVLDQRAGAHLDRPWRDDLERQPRRCDRFEVAGVGEEGEDLVGRALEALLAVNRVMAEHTWST
jgi:hypothetical protein